VLSPEEPVDYSSIIKAVYPPYAVQTESFVGFKVLCTDTLAPSTNPRDRMAYIDSQLGFIIKNKGIIVRETNNTKPDGLWIITLPVPRSQVATALNNLFDVLRSFENYFGIVCDGIFDVCVSGRCPVTEIEKSLQGITIPKSYMSYLIPTNNILFSIGQIQRINDMFMCLRTRWDLKSKDNGNTSLYFEDLAVLAQLISSLYH
jgi:hypothetical protein